MRRRVLGPGQVANGGFTLVELLVVISIVLLLVSILLPALGNARETARIIKCGSNQHQIGVAFHLYVNDEDGRLPYAFAQTSGGHWAWDDFLAPYLSPVWSLAERQADRIAADRGMEVLACPGDPRELTETVGGSELAIRSYAMIQAASIPPTGQSLPPGVGLFYNPAAAPGATPPNLRLATSDLPDESGTAMLSEFVATYFFGSLWGNLQGRGRIQNDAITQNVLNSPMQQHPGLASIPVQHPHRSATDPVANFLYVDGHVAADSPANTVGDAELADPPKGAWTRLRGD